MSDDAAVWKLGFGALVLVACAVTVAVRKPHEPRQVAAPAMVMKAPATVTPLETQTVAPPAPPDVQEEPSPRIEYAVQDEQQTRAKPRVTHKPARRASHVTYAAPPRLHFVVAHRRIAGTRPHYPFDPRQRWQSRELP
jgi:hypothetical protein